MDERLDQLLGEIFMIKDDMEVMIHLLNDLEILFEYKGDSESRYFVKSILLISEQIKKHVNTAADNINQITK